MAVSKENNTKETLDLPRVYAVLKGRRGAMAELARALGVSSCSVTLALQGRPISDRIVEAALRKARTLIKTNLEERHEQK